MKPSLDPRAFVPVRSFVSFAPLGISLLMIAGPVWGDAIRTTHVEGDSQPLLQLVIQLRPKSLPAYGSNRLDTQMLSDTAGDITRRYGFTETRPLFPRLGGVPRSTADRFHLAQFFVVEVPSRAAMGIIARLGQDPAIETVERVGIVRASSADPFLTSSGSWGQAFDDMWGYHAIGLAGLPGPIDGRGVTVAVLDTGIDSDHADLGTVVGGYDHIDDDDDANDENGHGTHVAGIIAATRNNGLGIAGVAPGVTLVPYKVLDATGNGPTTALAQAIRDAADDGADVISMSLGALGEAPEHVKAAVAYAAANGVVMVGAAGNDGLSEVHYPASLPEVMCVSNWTPDDALSPSSNQGSAVELAAPGTGILSLRSSVLDPDFLANTSPVGDAYLAASGTSQAVPYVSGVAALLLGRFSGVTADAARTHLAETARDVGTTGRDEASGAGMLDARSALGRLPESLAHPVAADPGGQWAVAIDADARRIAYLDGAGDDRSIAIRDIDTGDTGFLPRSASNLLGPQIDGRYVVYQGEIAGRTRVFVYDLEADTELTVPGEGANQRAGVLDGTRIAYLDEIAGRMQLCIYDVGIGDRRTVGGAADRYGPYILRAGRLIYVAASGGAWDVHTYDLVTGQTDRLTADPDAEQSCTTNGRLLVWTTRSGSDPGTAIVALDLGADLAYGTDDDSGPTFIVQDDTFKRWLSMDRQWLVWEQFDSDTSGGDNANIHGYGLGQDGVYGTDDDLGLLQITAEAANQLNPEVRRGVVVWEDWRNGDSGDLNVDLYMAALPSPALTERRELQADFDSDGDVDLGDYLRFQAAYSGAGAATADAATDLDGDGDTDLADLVAFMAAFGTSQ